MSPASVMFADRVGDNSVFVVRYAPHQRLETHAHDQDGLTVVLHGDAVEEVKHRTTVAHAGWAGARPFGVRHENRFGPRGAIILAIIPDRPTFHGLTRQWTWADSPVAYRAGLRLLRHSEDALVELVAALDPDPTSPRDTRAITRVCKMLEDPTTRPSVSALARELDLHPVYLARRFRQAFGVSIREYWTIRMVRRASELVVSTSQPLSRIAHECGFADHSHMCRAFQTVAGWHPSSIRRNSHR